MHAHQGRSLLVHDSMVLNFFLANGWKTTKPHLYEVLVTISDWLSALFHRIDYFDCVSSSCFRSDLSVLGLQIQYLPILLLS